MSFEVKFGEDGLSVYLLAIGSCFAKHTLDS